MITDYKPTVTNVIEDLFGVCTHASVSSNSSYCKDYSTKTKLKNIHREQELLYDLSKSNSASCGYYITKLNNFIYKYSDSLIFNPIGTKGWYDCCMVLDENIHYYTDSKHNLSYQICWLAEILYRYLIAHKSLSKEDVRGIINET